MHITCLGLNHTTAPIELREQLSLNDDAIRSALTHLAHEQPGSPIAELVILSTCNRIELYAVSTHGAITELETFLSNVSRMPPQRFRSHLYRYEDVDAARHLFEVAAGLDSLVIGEPQILGQVTRALEISRAQNMAGPMLNRLFQSAIHAGKRARTETNISRNPASISSLAASLAERAVHPFAEAQVVILGAGEMAELAVDALRKRGAHRIRVINRTLERAESLSKRWQADVSTFDHLEEALSNADIVISSTGAPHLLVTADMIRRAMLAREQRPLLLIDIAVPRDIDPAAAQVPNVKLYNIDHLNQKLEGALSKRMTEARRVKSILEEEIAAFSEYLASLEMITIIAEMRQQAEAIRQEMLQKTLRRLPDLTDDERSRIEAMTQALIKKILQAPTHRLRAEALCPYAPEYAAVARTLFGMQSDGLCAFSGKTCSLPLTNTSTAVKP